jgi:hypothetical protein
MNEDKIIYEFFKQATTRHKIIAEPSNGSFMLIETYDAEVFDWILEQNPKLWKYANDTLKPWRYTIQIHMHLYHLLLLKFNE